MLLKVTYDGTPMLPTMDSDDIDGPPPILFGGTTLLVLEKRDYPGGTYYRVLSPSGTGWVYEHNVTAV